MKTFFKWLFAREPIHITLPCPIIVLRPGDVALAQFSESLSQAERAALADFLKSKKEFENGLVLVFDRCAMLSVARSPENREEDTRDGA